MREVAEAGTGEDKVASSSAGWVRHRPSAVAGIWAAAASATRRRSDATASAVAATVSHVACVGLGLSFCSRARHVPKGTRPPGDASRIDSTAAESRSRAAPREVAARPMLGGSRAALPRRAACSRVAARAVETEFLEARDACKGGEGGGKGKGPGGREPRQGRARFSRSAHAGPYVACCGVAALSAAAETLAGLRLGIVRLGIATVGAGHKGACGIRWRWADGGGMFRREGVWIARRGGGPQART
eukprot:scaffold29917_cov96-Isochrysis_galbana.AAC.1